MAPPDKIILSGIVYSGKTMLARIGDVAIHPGVRRTPYIDATIFDGAAWRNLDLKGFGFGLGSREFTNADEIGRTMRQIENKIKGCKGHFVYYDFPAGSTRRKYIFRGMPFPTFI